MIWILGDRTDTNQVKEPGHSMPPYSKLPNVTAASFVENGLL
jgi:hypothetical protein